jgi:anti-anti-sigma regulatory factor
MNLGFSNSSADLGGDWPGLSSPRGLLTRFAQWLGQKRGETTERIGVPAPLPGAAGAGGAGIGEADLLGAEGVGPALFDVNVNSSAYATTIALRGALTATACDRLADTVERALDKNVETVVLDLRGIEVVDLAGVHVMLVAHLRASDQLSQLLLVPGLPAVQRVIDPLQGPFVYIDG